MTAPTLIHDLKYKDILKQHNPKYIIGIDEVGWGAIAGPLVLGCVILPVEFTSSKLKDSKKFGSAKARKEAHDFVMKEALYAFTHSVDADLLAYHGAGRAIDLALARVANEAFIRPPQSVCLKIANNSLVLIDGSRGIPNCVYKHACLARGDAIVPAISAASIIAKVTRDEMMRDLSHECPEYMWYKNKGYPTPAHLNVMKDVGVSIHHRRNVSLVQTMLEKHGEYEGL